MNFNTLNLINYVGFALGCFMFSQNLAWAQTSDTKREAYVGAQAGKSAQETMSDGPLNFIQSVKEGDLSAVQNFLKHASFDEKAVALGCTYVGLDESSAYSALNIAASFGRTEIVRELLHVANQDLLLSLIIFCVEKDELSSLQMAAAKGKIEVVEIFLEFAEKYPFLEPFILRPALGQTNALHFAVNKNEISVVRALLGSQYASVFLRNSAILEDSRPWQEGDKALWKTILEYAPQLAYTHAHLPGVGRLGQNEAAFFFRDIKRTQELEKYHLPTDQSLLFAMLSHKKTPEEEAYMEFMKESSPVSFYLAYYAASLGVYIRSWFY